MRSDIIPRLLEACERDLGLVHLVVSHLPDTALWRRLTQHAADPRHRYEVRLQAAAGGVIVGGLLR